MTVCRSFPQIRASVAAIMLFQVAALLIRSMLQDHLLTSGFNAEFAKDLSSLVVPAIEVILLWPIVRANKDTLRSLFQIPRPTLHLFMAALGIGVAARLAYWGAIIANTAFGWLGFAAPGASTGPQFWLACPPPSELILGVFVMVLLTPISEEIINRGLILGAIKNWKRNVAVLISAILFAFLHAPQGIPAAFVIGILLALQTLNCGSLLPAIVTHATYNCLAILDWKCFHGIWTPEVLTRQTSLVGTAAIIVGITFLLGAWFLATRIKGQDESIALTRQH